MERMGYCIVFALFLFNVLAAGGVLKVGQKMTTRTRDSSVMSKRSRVCQFGLLEQSEPAIGRC